MTEGLTSPEFAGFSERESEGVIEGLTSPEFAGFLVRR